jgi:hypothetical protein
MPTPPGWADAALPGWFAARITSHGPGYNRYIPGKGMLQVGHENRQYRWWLQTGPDRARPGHGGFAIGRQAMRDADRHADLLPPGTFGALNADELMALYRELTQARPRQGTNETGEWAAELASVRTEVFGQLMIAAVDPAYAAPVPWGFAVAAEITSAGAVEQTMTASQDRHRELREVPPTDQAIRAAAPAPRTRPAGPVPGGTSTDQAIPAGGAR